MKQNIAIKGGPRMRHTMIENVNYSVITYGLNLKIALPVGSHIIYDGIEYEIVNYVLDCNIRYSELYSLYAIIVKKVDTNSINYKGKLRN